MGKVWGWGSVNSGAMGKGGTEEDGTHKGFVKADAVWESVTGGLCGRSGVERAQVGEATRPLATTSICCSHNIHLLEPSLIATTVRTSGPGPCFCVDEVGEVTRPPALTPSIVTALVQRNHSHNPGPGPTVSVLHRLVR